MSFAYNMSINNIALSDLLVTELYGNTALIPSTTPQAPPPVAPEQVPVTPKPAPILSQPTPIAPASATPAVPATPATPAAPAEPQGYKFLGKNNRRITIIVDTPGAAFLPDPQLEFLTKILEACRMNIGDVAIVNHHTAPVAIAALRQQLQPQNVLLFGIEPTAIRLPINFPEFKVQPYDQCTYLSAPPLQQLVANTPDARLLKSKLWVCLKTLFDV